MGKSRAAQARATRAAAALRENLKRRKEQARGRKANIKVQTAGEAAAEGASKSHDSAGFVPDKPKG
jgi:hypothetical protein